VTIPPGAIFEAITPDPGVAVWDVAYLLPTKKGRPQPERKPGAKIVRCYVHKSGGEGGPGFAGILASARYVVTHRMFPGMPYTLWASTVPDVDPDGRLVLYRGAADDRRTWHTGGACNDHGIALALQGNLSKRDLTPDQRRVAGAGLAYVLARYPDLDALEPIGRHSQAKQYGAPKDKTICPGEYGERWLDGWLDARGA
jgi:hypothetical protein